MKCLVLFTCVFFAGCTSWSKPIDIGVIPNPDDSYMYGRFQVDAPYRTIANFDGYQTIGLLFTCSDGKNYKIQFNRKPEVQLIRMPPSICSFSYIVFTGLDGVTKKQNEVTSGLFREVEFVSGKAYYLGDFTGLVNMKNSDYNKSITSWKIDSLKNDYQKTTIELKKKYVNFLNIETIDLLDNE